MASRVLVVIGREWTELRQTPLLLVTLLLPAIIFAAVPLLSLVLIRGSGPVESRSPILIGQAERLRELQPIFRGLSDLEVLQAFGVSQFPVLFLMVPILVPLTLAAHSVVGEKQARTLEPLLATPIATWELVVAKATAAWVPGVVVSWSCYGGLLLLARPIAPPAIWAMMTGPMWIAEAFVVAPLLSLLAVGFSIAVSSRVNDARLAQQIGGIFVIPIFALLFGQISGVMWLNPSLLWGVALVAAMLDVVMFALAVRLFGRETILTRWR